MGSEKMSGEGVKKTRVTLANGEVLVELFDEAEMTAAELKEHIAAISNATPLPTEAQWLRARAIHAYFEGQERVDTDIHRLVFAFCDCPPLAGTY